MLSTFPTKIFVWHARTFCTSAVGISQVQTVSPAIVVSCSRALGINSVPWKKNGWCQQREDDKRLVRTSTFGRRRRRFHMATPPSTIKKASITYREFKPKHPQLFKNSRLHMLNLNQNKLIFTYENRFIPILKIEYNFQGHTENNITHLIHIIYRSFSRIQRLREKAHKHALSAQ